MYTLSVYLCLSGAGIEQGTGGVEPMQARQKNNNEINLKDMLFHILYRWRTILLVALACGLVFGGYQFASDATTRSRDQLTSAEIRYQSEYDSWKTAHDRAAEEAQNYEKMIAAKVRQLEESPLYHLDPDNVWEALGYYYVQIDQKMYETMPIGEALNPADGLVQMYLGVLDNLPAEAAELFGTTNYAFLNNILIDVKPVSNENVFYILARADSQEKVEQELQYLTNRIMQMKDDAQSWAPHTVQVVRTNSYVQVRPDIGQTRNSISSDIVNYQNALNNARNILRRNPPAKPGDFFWTVGLFAFGIGFILIILFYGITYAVGGRFHESRDLFIRYQVPIYAEFNHSRAHRSGKFPDSLIEKLEFRKRRQDRNAAYDGLYALVNEKLPSGRLLLTGTVETDKITPIAEALKARAAEGQEVVFKGDLISDGQAVMEAGKSDAVILVEEKHVSPIKDIDRSAELLNIGEANVIGFVVI
ncbi:MAG: hypothetical protein IJG94_05375 [Clostridia bacterium]|nr:hypothetical protein [Clostridia bacterium]